MTTANASGTNVQIRSASAIDSNTWTVENDTAVVPTSATWYSSKVLTNSFVQEGSTYYIIFQGYDGSAWKIGYATASAPSGPYTVQGTLLQPSLSWEGTAVADPRIRKFGSTYYLFYTGNSGASCYNSYATSTSLTGTYTKSNILLTPKGLSYPEILFNSNDANYYLLGDDLASGRIGKSLYKRADLTGAFSDAIFSGWADMGASSANSILTLKAGSIIKSTGTFGLNTALRTKAAFVTYQDYIQFGYNDDTGATTTNNASFFGYTSSIVKAISSSMATTTATDLGALGTAYHTWEVTRRSNENKFYEDNTLLATHTSHIVTSSLPITFAITSTDTGELDVDWTLVRNFVSPEPSLASFGFEESSEHLTVTGTATQTAGTTQTITLTAITNFGNIYAPYTGDKILTLSGPATIGSSVPTFTDKDGHEINFGSSGTIHFTDGVATTDIKLYKAEDTEIDATDGTYSTTGDVSYDINVSVSPNVINSFDISSPSNITSETPFSLSLTAKDAYGNTTTNITNSTILSVNYGKIDILSIPNTEFQDDGVYTNNITISEIYTDKNIVLTIGNGSATQAINLSVTGVPHGVGFIPPSKPSISNLDITNNNGTLSLNNLPSTITQIAVSTSPDFTDSSWEDISKKDDLLKQYTNTDTLYIKFRTQEGGVSDTIIKEGNNITENEQGTVQDNGNTDTNNSNQSLQDGDIVKTTDSSDIYVIKYKNSKQYKRLLLSPAIFNYYLHLKWNNIKTISQQQLDQYQTSNLVKEATDTVIYTLTSNGDTGKRKPL
ncbi:MAG: hypothetical protein WCQ96_05180, partial [Patescibacteria group bacterium]